MRILIVGNSASIHTARWIEHINNNAWKIELFPSQDSGVEHESFKNIKVYHSFYSQYGKCQKQIKRSGINVHSNKLAFAMRGFFKMYYPRYRINQFKKVIKRTKPDIIHAIEIQKAGYLINQVRKQLKVKMPPSIVTNLGSDIYLFGRLKEHQNTIIEVMRNTDYYTCECERDVELARRFGFQGKVLAVLPNAGGFDLQLIDKLRSPGLVSERKKIMLKGYQHWAGRALFGLRALERCKDLLEDYEIVIYSASKETEIAAELFEQNTGVKTTILPSNTPHTEILRQHGNARISIGLSISDALSTSAIEALIMGSFPIQSSTSCINEWIKNNETGIIVHPEDPDVIAEAIRKVLIDDDLVNQASERNFMLAKKKLDTEHLKSKILGIYSAVAKEKGISD